MPKIIFFREFWPIILVSARMIGLFSWMPGFSDLHIPFRVRMMVAVGLGIAFSSTLILPNYPKTEWNLWLILLCEYATGMFLGLILRICASALETAGTIMSQSVGLSNILVQNQIEQEQTPILTSFFSIAGITFIFFFDLHHLIIWGAYNSYDLIPTGHFNMNQDKAIIVKDYISHAFVSALKFSMPFFIFGNVVYLCLGILNKLIPQIQVFFLSLPLQILIGLIILMLSMNFIIHSFADYFSLSWSIFIG